MIDSTFSNHSKNVKTILNLKIKIQTKYNY